MPGRMGFARNRVASQILSYTYTREKRTAVAYDPAQAPADTSHDLWGTEQTQHAVADTTIQVPCSFSVAEELRITPQGEIMVRTPTLQVAYDDPLTTGDWVRDVQTTDNPPVVLLVGPAEVQTILPINPSGPVLGWVARLQQAQVEE